MNRGEVWDASLNPTEGSEQAVKTEIIIVIPKQIQFSQTKIIQCFARL
ncbi:MAG: hypothetical protein AAF630_14390 [Cyanobacteria bacterium P01_C01_bin.38]